MARKTSTGTKTRSDKVHIKFVKKAGLWVKTYFNEYKQIQEWSTSKPD
jgi:hypothetical protein